MRRFLGRAALLVAPYALACAFVHGALWRVGEIVPTRAVVDRQARGEPFLFLPAFSDHTYALKRDAVIRLRPRVVALGGSRANQWRSAMFRPETFYNAGNSVYHISHYRRFIEELPSDAGPRVLIFTIDFFMFAPEWEKFYEAVSFEEMGLWWSRDRIAILKQAFQALAKDVRFPFVAAREPVYGLPAVGLTAIRAGIGTRIDGSYQYGGILHGSLPPSWVTPEAAVARVSVGDPPFAFRDHMEPQRWDELSKLAALCTHRGIRMIALSPPYDPRVMAAVQASPRHGIWREFHSQATAERIRSLGIHYFDFTKSESFGGDAREMLDPFHASETAHVRMLRKMLEQEKVRELFPVLGPDRLEERLKNATALEVYRNEF